MYIIFIFILFKGKQWHRSSLTIPQSKVEYFLYVAYRYRPVKPVPARPLPPIRYPAWESIPLLFVFFPLILCTSLVPSCFFFFKMPFHWLAIIISPFWIFFVNPTVNWSDARQTPKLESKLEKVTSELQHLSYTVAQQEKIFSNLATQSPSVTPNKSRQKSCVTPKLVTEVDLCGEQVNSSGSLLEGVGLAQTFFNLVVVNVSLLACWWKVQRARLGVRWLGKSPLFNITDEFDYEVLM